MFLLPPYQIALVQAEPSSPSASTPALTTTKAIPQPAGPYDILIRVTAVALNPTDYKLPLHHPTPGATMGCDFVGTVMTAATASTWDGEALPQPGTRVCGAVHGSDPGNPDIGAFAEYLVADARLVLRVPVAWSDLEAAALGGIGWGTLGLAFYDTLRLEGRPSAPVCPKADGGRVPVLVYGGATATGPMACQLLSLSGYSPIATASPASSQLVQSYAAASTVPYTASDCVARIRKETNASLRHALDCITSPESAAICCEAMCRAGGRYASLEFCPEEWRKRKVVQMEMVLGYEMFGREVMLDGVYHRHKDVRKLELSTGWCREVQVLVNQGLIRSHPVREVEGSWEGIVKGLQMMRKGEVRGEKLVVRLSH
ncbi:alcohol dehydrogenase GroES-like domain-containing protein [Aspergillus violaceofuscus CBS 115571]|uniref:Alcohol dehydrogenase GroES-like domain-containing protein n=1 Tax=Aspergillus violaceofuscus (strain CBS 115571) TaxID=1450538 RepID=A0A2V5H5K9_ASPV1|nr:alcohol dehydrogenase GroES-like domain-containing protein [Aspergillus violaceofuscus CBS 115571]